MGFLEAIILGIVQGLTEFLPISSSGHLLVTRAIFGNSLENTLSYDAILQFASVLAIIIYFFSDLIKILKSFISLATFKKIDDDDRVLLLSIIWGTIPAIIAGFLLEDLMDSVFRNVKVVAGALIFGSLLMYVAQTFYRDSFKENKLTVKKGLLIGFFQVLALIPGVSRSGATISGGFFMGLERVYATRFSFLLSVPILFGSGLKKLFEIRNIFDGAIPIDLIAGFFCSFVVSIISIHFLLKFLKNHNLNLFIFYRLVLAIVILLFL